MRPISEDLRTAQRSPGVAWSVTAMVQKRASFQGRRLTIAREGYPWEIWDPLYLPYQAPGQPCDLRAAACACAAAATLVHVLRSDAAGKIGVRRLSVVNHTITDSAPVDVATLTAPYAPGDISTPGIAQAGGVHRLVYADGAQVCWLQSHDDGVTWSAPALLYNGAGFYVRYSNISVVGDDERRWAVVYSAWTPGGEIRLRGAHDVGAGWVQWPVYSSSVDWEVAGVVSDALENECHVYLHGRNYTWSSVAVGRVSLTGGAFAAWWPGQPATVDRAGLTGELAYSGVRVGRAAGATWLAMREGSADGRKYWVLAALAGVGAAQMEEPQVVVTHAVTSPAPEETMTLVQSGRYVFLLGAAAVAAAFDDTPGAQPYSVDVVAYRYEQRLGSGGKLRLTLRRVEGSCAPGDVVEITRTASALSAAGTVVTGADSRIFRVVDAWETPTGFEVVAVDGTGALAAHVLRRQKTLRAGDRQRADDVRALLAWSGVAAETAALPGGAGLSPGFVAPAGFFAWDALQQYLLDLAVIVRPGRMESGVIADDPLAVAVTPTVDNPHEYGGDAVVSFADIGGWSAQYPALTHPAHWTERRGAAARTLVVALGMLPDGVLGGEDWRAGLTGGFDGVRPQAVVHVNRGWAAAQLDAVVEAERQRELVRHVRLRLRCPAHVGLELYDKAQAFDVETCRIIGITETWQGGRLEQEVEMG
jgi:hypothetical protein